ncbi:MAG: hypothetical protein ACAI34_20730 [Verrucomicrobium sp.]|nr:hypothetical protein [Verrucomicrobium sp.]
MAKAINALATTNLNLANALGTCGVVITIDRQYDEPSGDTSLTFYLAAKNVPNPADLRQDKQEETSELIAGAHILGGPLKFDTKKLLADFRAKKLQSTDPTHPFLTCLRGQGNREQLLTWIKQGRPCRIAVVSNAGGMTCLEPGQEPMGWKLGQKDFETWTTDDLKLAAALGLVGVPVIAIESLDERRTRFTLPRYGYELGGQRTDAIQVTKDFRRGALKKLNPSHAVVWGYQTLLNRDKLLRDVNDQRELVMLRYKDTREWRRDTRSALVVDDASNDVLDRATQHLRHT